ncbi:prolipoprotein diacylglyceryl transferase [Sphingomonas oryzagri]|uniref:Phosphatidylglycerol--prolipoprotein diacylglyceryl transferase n=1 Tax=Sphingomonas oryzagri TaxID=3042314 RepID=A0ABT6N3E8_9SPHN|nr:prolipoprotein diacylglyceryl transferase [Sphingomonas oryzagri]MDH7639833.1 prolipoprotein diacylglyceryl transferase [Sphingomonas oryzagri]
MPAHYIHFTDLHLHPEIFRIGWFALRWYSLAYITGIIAGWWYVLKLIDRPGAPMARRHVDDFVFWATIAVIAGGRIGYILFYDLGNYLLHPLDMLKLWEGGMSFHGATLGVTLAMWWFCRKNGLSLLRFADYIACVAPIGLFFGRLANFVNGELWGKVTTVPWAIVFPNAGPLPRHPSQLYEAGLEGLVLFAILNLMFWKSKTARYQPGLLCGTFLTGYGAFRFFVEFFRQPDQQFNGTFLATTIHMGQLLDLPMLIGGLYLIATAKGRRQRVEPIAGSESVA